MAKLSTRDAVLPLTTVRTSKPTVHYSPPKPTSKTKLTKTLTKTAVVALVADEEPVSEDEEEEEEGDEGDEGDEADEEADLASVIGTIPVSDNQWRMRLKSLVTNQKTMKCPHFKIKRFHALCLARNKGWGIMANTAFVRSVGIYSALKDATEAEKTLLQGLSSSMASWNESAGVEKSAVASVVPPPKRARTETENPREYAIEPAAIVGGPPISRDHFLDMMVPIAKRARPSPDESVGDVPFDVELELQDRLQTMADAVITQVVAKTTAAAATVAAAVTAAINKGDDKINETLSTELRELKNLISTANFEGATEAPNDARDTTISKLKVDLESRDLTIVARDLTIVKLEEQFRDVLDLLQIANGGLETKTKSVIFKSLLRLLERKHGATWTTKVREFMKEEKEDEEEKKTAKEGTSTVELG